MMRRFARGAFRVLAAPSLALALAPLGACDNRDALRAPDPSLARMLQQRRADPYAASTAFADGKTMRDPPRGTVPRDAHEGDASRPPVTRALLERGRTCFEQICATCHGVTGDGHSVVATKMVRRPPPSLHDARSRALTREQLHDVITRGYGLMPALTEMLDADDRWAVVAYVAALQLARGARASALPPELRAELAREAP
jgi:mono/diheme cytochrome c family protein